MSNEKPICFICEKEIEERDPNLECSSTSGTLYFCSEDCKDIYELEVEDYGGMDPEVQEEDV